MFEGSLVESRGLAGTGTERWTALGSVTIQLAVAGLLIAIPLLRPQVLRIAPLTPPVALPFIPKPHIVQLVANASAATTAMMSQPAAQVQAAGGRRFVFPRLDGNDVAEVGPPMVGPWMGTGDPTGTALLIAGTGTGPVVSVAKPKEPGLTKVSSGVSEGLLLTPIQPVYPPIARAVRVQGAVVIEAVISKVGRLESVNVVSGPEMLRDAALRAVQAARYRPYLLNGQPTEVKTTYRVVFSLGS